MMKEKKSINIEIGRNIKQCREAAGLTQESLAELVGLGVKHISAIECGAVGVSLTTLAQVCRVLAVSSDELIFGPPDTTQQDERIKEIQLLTSRLSLLPANEFKAIKELLDKAMELVAVAKGGQ